MKALKKLSAAALALTLPLAGLAQTPEAAKPAESAPAAAPAPAPTPAPAPVAKADEGMKVTPYGFILLNSFWDGNALSTHDYPGQAARTNEGGAFLMSARQSRIGMRLAVKDNNWTGADLSGVLEFDFKGGHAGASPATTASTSWYNGLMRLRLAAMTATWNTTYGKWAVLAGQEYGLVNPLFAESLAWVADPLFWQAGNLWRRSPQIRLSYSGQFDAVGLSLAAAMLSPADAGTPVDYGYGNKSRAPNFEARAAVSVKATPDVNGTVGFGIHTGKRRYGYGTPDQKDITQTLYGVDADLNLTQYLQAKGEWFKSEGADDTYNTIASPSVNTAPPYQKVDSDGFWAQGIVKPLPQVWLTIGYGQAKVTRGDMLAFVTTAAGQAAARWENTQLAGGVLFNAGKYWRFGLEALKVETKYLDGYKTDATQIALSSQLKF